MTEPIAPQPLVTVVLVCWNHARFVRSAILSVVRQTYPNQQVIVFDNDSTDGSPAIIEALAAQYGFEFIRQPNVGLVKTLNRGLALARGEYFAVMATDDMWLLDKTERQVAYMQAHPEVVLTCGNSLMIDANDHLIGMAPANRPAMAVSFRELMVNGNCVHGPSVMLRTAVLRELGGYDESWRIEDYTLALRLTHAGHAVHHLGLALVQYRRHGANWTARPIYAENLNTGRPYRHTPEYPLFVKRHARGYFRMLAGSDKRAALDLLRREPIALSLHDVGVGFIKLATPRALIQALRRVRRQPPQV